MKLEKISYNQLKKDAKLSWSFLLIEYLISMIGLAFFVFTYSSFGLLVFIVFLIFTNNQHENYIHNKIRMELLIIQNQNKKFLNSIYGKNSMYGKLSKKQKDFILSEKKRH